MKKNTVLAAAVGAASFSALNSPQPAPAQTPQDIADQIKQAVHDLQAANDDKLAAIEKTAGETSTTVVDITNKVETINKAITELQDLADEQAKTIARSAMAGGGDDVRAEREHAAQFFSLSTGRAVSPAAADLDVAKYKAYKDAFEAVVRADMNMEHVSGDIRAAMEIGSDRDGGYFVPPEISTEIEQRVFDTSPMRQEARVITVGSSAWEAPYKSSKGISGGWVGERQERQNTGTGQVGMQRISVHEQYAYPEVTQDMLDDAQISVESMLVEDTEMEMSRTENLGFVSGDGVMKPKGFLAYAGASVTTADKDRAWGQLQHRAAGASGAFPKIGATQADDPSALISLIADLNPVYRQGAIWTMNRQTEAAVRKLRDAEGRYLVGFGDMQDGTTGFNLHGYPIRNFEDMPDIASDSFSIAFGNFRRGYFIIDRAGFRLLRDPYTNKPYVGFYITKRTGGDVRNFDAIKLLKFSA